MIGSRTGRTPTNTSAISGTGAATSITANQDILVLPSGMYVQLETSIIATFKNTPINSSDIKEIEVLRLNSSGYGVTLCFLMDRENVGMGYYTFSRGTTHQQWKRML